MRINLTLSPERLPAGISKVLLRQIIRATCLRALPKVFEQLKRGVNIEVGFVSDAKMAKLNRDYRAKHQPTDVLSFGEFGDPTEVMRVNAKTVGLGTLILSLPYIKRSAKQDGVSWKREFVFVFSHGVLHLLGYDHNDEMFAIQDVVTDKLARS